MLLPISQSLSSAGTQFLPLLLKLFAAPSPPAKLFLSCHPSCQTNRCSKYLSRSALMHHSPTQIILSMGLYAHSQSNLQHLTLFHLCKFLSELFCKLVVKVVIWLWRDLPPNKYLYLIEICLSLTLRNPCELLRTVVPKFLSLFTHGHRLRVRNS